MSAEEPEPETSQLDIPRIDLKQVVPESELNSSDSDSDSDTETETELNPELNSDLDSDPENDTVLVGVVYSPYYSSLRARRREWKLAQKKST